MRITAMADANSISVRTCTRCKVEFPATLEHFPPHKAGRYGLHSNCRACKKEVDAARRRRPDQKARQQAWRDANRERIKAYNQAYRDAGYKSTEHVRAWVSKNQDRARQLDREKVRRYRRTKPWYNLKMRVMNRVWRMLKDGKGSQRTEEILGYSIHELVAHIERQFTKGMTWEKLMAGEIHIDHIIPVSHFKAESVDSDEFRACWALTNLRPMWADENRSKSAKILTLL